MAMRLRAYAICIALQIGIAGVFGGSPAHAQNAAFSIALKSGESSELTEIYWVSNCRSLMKGTPEAEILDGPKEVTLEIKEAMVLPRAQNCATRVPGAKLVIKAKDIEESSYTRLTIRITVKGRDGNRQISHVLNLSLLP